MKKLNQFLRFDFDEFAMGKRFMAIGQQEWKDYNTANALGTRIKVVIVQDKTVYEVQEGEIVSNLYEKFTVKIPKAISIPMNSEIRLKNAEATVYGDYRNQLSVIAEDIEVISNK